MADSTKRVYVAMTMHYWGKGDSEDVSLKEMRKAGGSANAKKYGVIVKLLPEGAKDAYVDSFGAICWSGPPGESVTIKNTAKSKKKP